MTDSAPLISKAGLPAFLKALGAGVALIVLLYGLLGGWLWLSKDEIRQNQSEKLASQTVIIDHTGARAPQTAATDDTSATEAAPNKEAGATVSAETATPAKPPVDDTPIDLTQVDPEGYYETSPTGPVPKITQGNQTVFNLYKRPFETSALLERPTISLILLDYGLSESDSAEALTKLLPPVSLTLSPYADSPPDWVERAHQSGHEVWMDFPLEPATYPQEDPGPHTLLVGAPEQENYKKLNWLMSRTRGVIGFVNTGDTAFTESTSDLRPVMGAIFSRGFGYISDPESGSVIRAMAKGAKAPYSGRLVVLDESPNKEDIDAALQDLESRARTTGQAIGAFRPYPVSLAQITRWAESLRDKGFNLAPASALAASRL